MGLEPSERVAELIGRLDEVSEGHAKFCEVCAAAGWQWLPETLWIGGVEMLAYYCRTCGHLRLHSVTPADLSRDEAS